MKYKTIKCDCGKEMKIPENMDEDYHKNEYPCVLWEDDVEDCAYGEPYFGCFMCSNCYFKARAEVPEEERGLF